MFLQLSSVRNAEMLQQNRVILELTVELEIGCIFLLTYNTYKPLIDHI